MYFIINPTKGFQAIPYTVFSCSIVINGTILINFLIGVFLLLLVTSSPSYLFSDSQSQAETGKLFSQNTDPERRKRRKKTIDKQEQKYNIVTTLLWSSVSIKSPPFIVPCFARSIIHHCTEISKDALENWIFQGAAATPKNMPKRRQEVEINLLVDRVLRLQLQLLKLPWYREVLWVGHLWASWR